MSMHNREVPVLPVTRPVGSSRTALIDLRPPHKSISQPNRKHAVHSFIQSFIYSLILLTNGLKTRDLEELDPILITIIKKKLLS